MPKLNVYTLGQHGINRVKSPIQVTDGELLSCQNASIKLKQKQLALSKRDGMAKINEDVAAGSILSIVNIPFVYPSWLPAANNWIIGTSTPAIAAKSVAWSPLLDIFVAVGDHNASGSAMYSYDGLTWTQDTINAATVNWTDVVWASGLNKFVATGNPSLSADWLAWSANGLDWTTPSLPANSNSYTVAYSPSLNLTVLAPSDGATIRWYSSSDLVTYDTNDQAFSKIWPSICWSPDLNIFCAVSSTAGTEQAATSADGITWTLQTTGINSGWQKVIWSETLELFVAVASTGTDRVMTSPDGVTWTAQTAAEANAWNDLVEYNGSLVAVASGGTNRVMVSTDAIVWTSETAAAANSWQAITIAPELEKVVAVASTGAIRAMYSE